MKSDWKELTMQEKKAGVYNPFLEPLSIVDRRMTYPESIRVYPNWPVILVHPVRSPTTITRIDKGY